MATHSSILAWRIPRTGEPVRLQSMGLQRTGHDWSDLAHLHTLFPLVLRQAEDLLFRDFEIYTHTKSYVDFMFKTEEAMAPHSSTLDWKIPWAEEPGRLKSMGSPKSRTQLSNFTFTFHFHALEKEMATHSSVLAWRIPGTGEPGGLTSMGSHRVGHDWSDLAAAAACLRNFLKNQTWEPVWWEDYNLESIILGLSINYDLPSEWI